MNDEIRSVKKKRTVIRGQVTRIRTRLAQLNAKEDEPETSSHAWRMATRLEDLDAEFKIHHLALVDLIESDDELEKEQGVLDEHEDQVADLVVRIERLISSYSSIADGNLAEQSRVVLGRKLAHLTKCVDSITKGMERKETVKRYVIEQFQEELSDRKKELAEVRNELLSLHVEEKDELYEQQSRFENGILELLFKIRKSLQSDTVTDGPRDPSKESNNVRLPRLEIPDFSGDLLNWRSFWQRFSISIHEKTNLSNAENWCTFAKL